MKFIPFLEDQPKSVVVVTYNDLVLYCSINHSHHDYHIYNPYTKQSVALPPTSGINREQLVGFICDPYYKYSGKSNNREPYYKHSGELDDRDDKKEQTSTTTPCSIILNAAYRWMVVRIVSNPIGSPGFRVQIISSETGEWGEFVVPSSRNPFSTIESGDNIPKYHFIEYPENLGGYFFDRYLGVCGGHLRMCVVTDDDSGAAQQGGNIKEQTGQRDVAVRDGREQFDDEVAGQKRNDSKDDGVRAACSGDGGVRAASVHVQPGDEVKFKWLAQRVSLPPKDIHVLYKAPRNKVAAFYPNDQDVICLQLHLSSADIVVCKHEHRGGTLEMVTEVPFNKAIYRAVYPFVIPFWPTPVPRLSSE
ncbi:hypothetical protein M0R45_020905 [Rubus argutus]